MWTREKWVKEMNRWNRIQPHTASHSPCPKGFTLIEIIIVIVIVGIISTIAAMIILQGVKSYAIEDQRSNVHYQARLAVERIAREARHIRNCSSIVGPLNPSGTLQFTDIQGSVVTFTVGGGNLSRNGNLLANGITSATPFRFLDINGNPTTTCPGIWFIEIDITDTQGSESLQMRTRIHPMNF
ncbi:MAG: prepilin-type N-terminal cleavage/methylation domain-containing protein [Nitrospirota bacterium]